jgi:hypothetical protein
MTFHRYAMNLLRRLEAIHKDISGVRYMLPQVAEADEVFAAYELAHASIEQFIHNTHSEWFHTIEAGIEKELHANLLAVDKASGESS